MSSPVEELLASKGISYRHSGQDLLTKCLNPEHNDSNPSFRVDKTTGVSHCFSCGFKVNIFRYFGIFSNNTSIKVAKLKEKLHAVTSKNISIPMLKGARAFNNKFRGISAATFQAYDMFTTDVVPEMSDRLVMPIKDVSDNIIGFVGRHTLSNVGAKYMNYPANAAIPPYPVKLHGAPKSAFLVEGMFDMLNLYDKGIHNAVCAFGTSKLYKDAKSRLMPYKVQGVQKWYLLFDGDEPGRKAANNLKPIIEAAGFAVEVLELPDDMDPGNLDQESVDQLKKLYK